MESGSTAMSGLVAQRLFALLPPRMPAGNFELAANIWQYYGPRSASKFTVGPNADPKVVLEAVRARFETTIKAYRIPETVRARFDWLSAGDVTMKKSLLDDFPIWSGR